MKKLLALVAVFALVAFAAPAFAANPFVDVPMNHWAYDAISQLAAKGIIQGYPDGTYRGNQPMTRYEMSMLVARALATVDMDKASKEDVEMLKKLVVEFKDELDALGVRVDALDERVAVLEENLGGWKFWGELRLDAKWTDEENGAYGVGNDTDFDLNRFRLWMSRQIDDKTTVTMLLGRSGSSGVNWDRYYATIQLPWDSSLMLGKWLYDWEGEAGLYNDDEDAWFTDTVWTGFYWRKNLAKGDITLFAARNDNDENAAYTELGDMYGARFNFQLNDKFRIALSGLYFDYDHDYGTYWYHDYGTYWADFGITFTPGFQFKGAYYMQDHDGPNKATFDDSPNAYKAIIDVSQDTLKFTSLWIEYANFDPNFHTALSPWDNFGAELTPGLTMPAISNVWETDALFVKLQQKWSDKWATYQRYGQFEHDPEAYAGLTGSFDITNWTFGVQYWYTPTVLFELAYDDVDYDEGWTDVDPDLKDDSLVRLRTWIFF
ncbi:S-layer homology domain-containing protein [Acetomicrobium hydrogeniformans]|uniref:S-layer homology domain-containing protein n=1 Tax=Acetomicrobium hydrogeniformans TaxID=649746 RepID=A0A7V6ZEQ0_9BACT|nr:S-layer homology domain-containing protein [Acetomicrobium hydrogeniformans]HHZ04406.1 S-layer homology domain-containing protein [Acetomicrobium hydrogeniformans]